MTDDDATRRAECDRYREMADDIRKLAPQMKHSEAAEDLQLLAARYARLAEWVEEVPTSYQESQEADRK